MTTGERQKKTILAVNVGLIANTILAFLKTGVGIIGHSPALLADGINSTSDVAYGIVVRIFMLLSGKPADEEHPYGHDRLESIAAVVVGAFVITTANVGARPSKHSRWSAPASPTAKTKAKHSPRRAGCHRKPRRN